ncbi:MAG: thiamine phosphate synthase [Candidatus Omnitrophica bacterium]|nr:thiamine phosphate synthase [Candidatus Omnitrophota bacterium]
MKLRKKLLKKSFLYLIIDKEILKDTSVTEIASKVKNMGVDIIQYRDKTSDKKSILKNAFQLRNILAGTKTLFIINDYIDIAMVTDSDGVHLGQQDIPLTLARKILGKNKLIGVSCSNLKEALLAQKQGADYIGLGAIFSTPTKPERKAIGLKSIESVKERIKIPFFVIGGINSKNLKLVMSNGARRVAVCREICLANNIASQTKMISKLLNN